MALEHGDPADMSLRDALPRLQMKVDYRRIFLGNSKRAFVRQGFAIFDTGHHLTSNPTNIKQLFYIFKHLK